MIQLVDSHSHLFLEEFSDDLPEVIHRAVEAGVSHIFMPNIDSTTVEPLLRVCDAYKELCYPMIGLHPTSVDTRYEEELEGVLRWLKTENRFVAIGEIGLDLYWDKTFFQEQLVAFEKQVEWAFEFNLPIVIHSREAFSYIYKVLLPYKNSGLRGIFHSFTGDADEAALMMEFPDFMIGINGVVTFKKSTLPDVLSHVPLDRIVLETDSPYLTPVPFRGKRNESSYVHYTLLKLAEIYGKSPEETSKLTAQNALKVFGMLK